MPKLINNIFFIADGWGATKGGINAFNYDLCIALGKISKQYYCKVFCVYSGTVPDSDYKIAVDNNVELISIDPNDFKNKKFSKLENYVDRTKPRFWIGHDIITGEHAAKCSQLFGGKTVMFHHMDYEAYYSAKASGKDTRQKIDLQNGILEKAQLLIGVGPKLYDSIKDKFPDKDEASIGQVIPGLAEIDCTENVSSRTRLISLGRIEEDNDSIKQFKLLIKAFGKLVKESCVTSESSVTLIGLSEDEKSDIENEYRQTVSEIVDGFANVMCLPYTTDRNKLFSDIKKSSIAVMPSLSEGFGLVGLEAIAAGVPLVLTKNSGLYQFLAEKDLNGYVEALDIKGYIGDEVNEQDVNNMYKILKEVINNIEKRKKRALKLKEILLQMHVTWQTCAEQLLNLLGIKQLNKRELLLLSMINPQILAENDELRKFTIECACTCDKKFVEEESKRKSLFDENKLEFLNIDDYEFTINDIIDLGEALDISGLETYSDKKEPHFVESAKAYLDMTIAEYKKIGCNSDQLNDIINDDFIDDIQSDDLFSDFESWERRDIKFGIKHAANNAGIRAVLDDESRAVLRNYHDELIKRNNYLDFDGLSIMISNEAQRIPLNEVYAEMDISPLNQNKHEDDFIEDRQPIIERLLKNNRTIILGDPGSGKSTLMKKLLVEACSEESRKTHDIVQMCVSVHISEFSNWLYGNNNGAVKENKICVLDEYIERNVLFNEKVTAIYKRLKAIGGIIYFIDGLDEAKSIYEKSEIKKYITELKMQTDNSVFIMTSRKVGFDDSYKELKFAIMELNPLSDDSIEEYIEKWYKAIDRWHANDEQAGKILQKAPRLISTIENEVSLKTLAKNPLLLSIIVILHYHGINLPNNKVKLYETITKTLLETWIEKRGVSEKIYGTDYLSGFFSKVGYEIIKNNYDNMLISKTKLRDIYISYEFANVIEGVVEISDKDVDEFIRYISELAGILLNKGCIDGESYYGFLMHRQFTEYFAAIELEGDIEFDETQMTDIISEPKWIEVFTLMGCYMNNQMRGGRLRVNKITNKLLDEKSKPMPDLDYNLQMALRLMASGVFLDTGTLNRIKERLTKIFQSTNTYKVTQFGEELQNIFIGSYGDWFNKFLIEMLESEEYTCVRNACIILDLLYSHKDILVEERDILSKSSKSIATAFAKLINNESDIRVFFRKRKGYFHALFVENFVNYVNNLTDGDINNASQKNKIYDLMACYVNNTPIRNPYRFNRLLDNDPFDTLIERSRLFKNKEFADMYIIEAFLQNYAFRRAISSFADPRFGEIKHKEAEIVKNLLESANNLNKSKSSNKERFTTRISITSVVHRCKVQYYRTDEEHKFNILVYNRNTNELNKYEFAISNIFTVNELRAQLNQYDSLANNKDICFMCLNIMRDFNLPDDQLYLLYNDALSNDYVLTNSAWRKAILRKISEDDKFFYSNYEEFVRRGIFNRRDKTVKLNDIFKIYTNIFSETPTPISAKSIKLLVNKYKETDDETCKFVLYDIINKVSNPFLSSK